MKHKVYNELEREPLVWGLHFPTLMLLVSFLVLATTVCIHIFVVWEGILLAFGSSFVFYLVALKYTATDKIELVAWFERFPPFPRAVRVHIESLKPCSQIIVIR